MKIKTILVMFAIFMLSGCFFSEDLTQEEQSDIRTAEIVGHIKCSKDGETYFDYDVLSFNRWGSSGVEFINKEGTLYADSINNCAFTANKGTAPRIVSNRSLYQ